MPETVVGAMATTTTSLVFDSYTEGDMASWREEVAKRFGNVEVGKEHKMAKGGVAIEIEESQALVILVTMKDWTSEYTNMQCHRAASTMGGTTQVIFKNFPPESTVQDAIAILEQARIKVMDMYRFTNKQTGEFTGMLKATVKGSQEIADCLSRGSLNTEWGIRLKVEKQRKPRSCFNCGKIGHMAKDCKSEKLCKQCGHAGHLKADCQADKDQLDKSCGYCHQEGHNKAKCQSKREDERKERAEYKESKELPNAWKQREGQHGNAEKNINQEIQQKKWQEETQISMQESMQESMKEMMKEMMEATIKKMLEEMMQEAMKAMMESMMQVMQTQMLPMMMTQFKQMQPNITEILGGRPTNIQAKRGLSTPTSSSKNKKKPTIEANTGENKQLGADFTAVASMAVEENAGEDNDIK